MTALEELGDRKFDVVLCNPPYLAHEGQVNQGTAAHEPSLAYFAADGGMAVYADLYSSWCSHGILKEGGCLLLEVAAGVC